jgi:hypothetical protein
MPSCRLVGVFLKPLAISQMLFSISSEAREQLEVDLHSSRLEGCLCPRTLTLLVHGDNQHMPSIVPMIIYCVPLFRIWVGAIVAVIQALISCVFIKRGR